MSDDEQNPGARASAGLDDPDWVDQIVARALAKAEGAVAAQSGTDEPDEPLAPGATSRPIGEVAAGARSAPAEPAIEPTDEPVDERAAPDVAAAPRASAPPATRPRAPVETPAAATRVGPSDPLPTASEPIQPAPAAAAAAATLTEPETVGDDGQDAAVPLDDVLIGAPAGDDTEQADTEADGTAVDGTAVDDAEQADTEADDDDAGHMRSILEWGAVIVGALVVAFLIKTFLLQAFFIPSGSMEPTLNVGDRVLVNKLAYDFHDVNRGDLIVFDRPAAESGGVPDLIKRVIALPGETIEFRDGSIFIDDRRLEEPYLAPGFQTSGLNLTTAGANLCGATDACTLPEGHVFVMGDNRSDSRDSRFFGPIGEGDIVGRAFLRVWPLSDLNFL